MADSTCSVIFLDPQPQPGDPDRVWFCISSDGKTTYPVTRTSCGCPWGRHNPATFLDKPCRHRRHLLDLLQENSPNE